MKPQELRVDMESFNGEKGYALYSRFYVGDEASKYQLQVDDTVGMQVTIMECVLIHLSPIIFYTMKDQVIFNKK